MPVSPQDFDLYSRVTGTPMPSDAMSRMQMAPDVYKFTKDFARKPNLLEKTGNLIKSAGRNTLVGAGLLAGMDLENQERQSQELLRNEIAKDDAVEATMSNPMEEDKETPLTLQIEQEKTRRAELTGQDKIKLKQMDIDAANTAQVASNLIEKTKEKVQEPTTADIYDQDVTENQTEEGYLNKKMEQGSEIATEGDTVAKVLSEDQDSKPSAFTDPKKVQQQMESDMVGASPSSKKVAAFFTKLGLDNALEAAGKTRDEPVELIGDDSPLTDNVDSELDGGEDQSGVPTYKNLEARGQNTNATKDLSDHHKEMRKVEALERAAEKSPSSKQIALGEMNKSREGFMAQDGPNKPAYDAKQRILKKTAEKRKEIEKTKGSSIVFMNAGSGESKEVPISDVNSVEDVKNMTKEVMSPSVNQRSDDFMAKFVPGARSDIIRGARSKKSLGVTRIPATNGDAQLGFVIANKVVPEQPKNVPLDSPLRDETGALRNPYGGATSSTTYGFSVAPGAEDMLENQITDKASLSSYMKRGLSEAKEGKKRKAGEVFGFLPVDARVVTGTANLGNM